MAFQLSPGVEVKELDLTTVVPTVAVSIGGMVGDFQWGPVNEVTTIDSENNLVATFGAPTSNTATSFFTAANFLAYANNLKVVRTVNAAAAKNAMANVGNVGVLVTNRDYYDQTFPTGSTLYGEVAAKYPGTRGNSIKISMADGAVFSTWAYKNYFAGTPGTSDYANVRSSKSDELHVIVLDADGSWTGQADTPLETFPFLSKGSDGKAFDGSSSYYKDVLNNRSKYVWWMKHPSVGSGTAWGSAITANVTFANLASNLTVTLSGGSEAISSDANIQTGWALFNNTETIDVNFLMLGAANTTVANYVTQNVAEVRKDAIAFISPALANVYGATASATAVTTFRDSLTSSSYSVMDSGWKYQYDRYNDTYRWIPLNGDIAGLCARTDQTNDPWWSPGGLNRGVIKNVVKLAYSPSKTDRDTLYVKGVNPVVTFPGQGTVLYGDKTLLARPSAFDRINVRRLFIVLEKAIATAAKYSLFEFNDAFTRSQFVNLVEPYLRDVAGRRGITDFKVVCDESNNTPEVIDRNEFVASIFVKPARSINFITLNFVATRTGVSFDEVVNAI